MTAPALVDFVTQAFHEMAEHTGLAALDVTYRPAERRRLLGGKSARLLRRDDLVALSDLLPDRHALPGVTTVIDTYTSPEDITFVMTTERGLFLIPGSRVVLVSRLPGG